MRELAVWLVLCLVWGSSWLFIKVGVADVPPLSFAGVRFILASTLLGLWLALRGSSGARVGGQRRTVGVLATAITGLLTVALPYGLIYWAEQTISSGLTAVLFASFPLFGLLFAHGMVPEERLTVRSVVGVSLGVFGVALLFWDELRFGGLPTLIAGAAVVVSAASAAAADVWIKAEASRIDPLRLSLGQMITGATVLMGLGWVFEGPPWLHTWTRASVVSLLYLSVFASAVGFVLLYWLVIRIPVTRAVLIALVTPWVALLLGATFLGERLGPLTVWGGAAIALGIWIAVVKPPVKPPVEPPATG